MIAAYCYTGVASSVCLSVCLSVCWSRLWALQNGWTDRDAASGAESGGANEPCIIHGSLAPTTIQYCMGVPVPPRGRGNFWGCWSPLKSIGSVCCGVRKAAEPIEMSFGAGVDSCGPKEPFSRLSQARTTPFSAVRGDKMGDAAFCQSSLTTCCCSKTTDGRAVNRRPGSLSRRHSCRQLYSRLTGIIIICRLYSLAVVVVMVGCGA